MKIKATPDTPEKNRSRQQKRRDKLNAIAAYLGYDSWAKFETAVINGEFIIKEAPEEGAK